MNHFVLGKVSLERECLVCFVDGIMAAALLVFSTICVLIYCTFILFSCELRHSLVVIAILNKLVSDVTTHAAFFTYTCSSDALNDS